MTFWFLIWRSRITSSLGHLYNHPKKVTKKQNCQEDITLVCNTPGKIRADHQGCEEKTTNLQGHNTLHQPKVQILGEVWSLGSPICGEWVENTPKTVCKIHWEAPFFLCGGGGAMEVHCKFDGLEYIEFLNVQCCCYLQYVVYLSTCISHL